MAALPEGSTFKPLMTCYLTDDTDPDDVERGFREGVFTGGEALSRPTPPPIRPPASPTIAKIMRVLARMEKIGMPFLIHGEDVDPEVDIFDREAMFIERHLSPMDAAVPRPADRAGAPLVEGRRRFRARARRRRSAAPSRPTT